MRVRDFILGLGCAALVAGCSPAPAGGGGAEKRLAELEKSVAGLKADNTDLRAKLKARNVFSDRSPLGDFFASPEFWECTYDSSWTDCSGRCSATTAAANKICMQKPAGPERVSCIEKATADGAACLKACPVQTSPTGPPSCVGGIGGPA
jgi:hypothetical protein